MKQGIFKNKQIERKKRMKKMKKLVSLLLTVVMVMAMTVTVFAAPSKVKITVPNNEGHVYDIFQIFTGDISTSDAGQKVLSNVKWGKNGAQKEGNDVSDEILAALGKITSSTSNADNTTIDSILSTLGIQKSSLTNDSAFKKDIVAGQSEEVPSGYYLVKDKDNSQANKDDAYTLLLISVVGPTTLTAKMDTTNVVKKVDDVNDSTGVSETLKDSADYDIGDAVPFTLTATLAENISAYKKYHITFVDTLESGKFSAISDLTIKLNGNDITNGDGYSVSTTGYTGDAGPTVNGFTKTIEFTATDGYLPESLNKATVSIEFTATLGENATIGLPGNENKVKLEYSNNPNDDQGGEEGSTPEDKVKVFTYKVDVNKVTGTAPNLTDLKGADFTLYKKVAGTTITSEDGETATSYPQDAKTGAVIKAAFDASVKADALEDETYYVVVGHKTGSAAGSTFEFKGVDDGEYVLVETTIPEGYNAWDATAFKISAKHSEGEEPTLTELTGGNLFSGNVGSVDTNGGKLETNVVNNQGTTLPETGGIGTTIFYVLGAILVLGAGIVLVTRRRMSVEK